MNSSPWLSYAETKISTSLNIQLIPHKTKENALNPKESGNFSRPISFGRK